MSETAPAETGAPEPFLPVTLVFNEQDLQQLPSYEYFYDKFNGTDCKECDESSKQALESELGKHSSISSYKEKIVKAYCCISNMQSTDPSYKDRCNFLYYWIVNALLGSIKEDSFSTVIQDILQAVEDFFKTSECTILDNQSINEKTIKERKIVFDYWHNYNGIKSLLQSSGSPCAQKYKTYVQSIDKVHKNVYQDCLIDKDNPYCEEFQKKQDEYDPDKLLTTTCPTGPASSRATQAGEGQSYLTAGTLDRLASKVKYYNRFEKKEGTCEYSAKERGVKTQLDKCPEIASNTEKITKGLCHVSSAIGVDGDNDVRCGFLYYWLGDIVWRSDGITNSSSFLKAMQCIYDALQEFDVKDNCTLLYEDAKEINQTMFSYWKIVNDFSNDYDDIRMKLNSNSNSCDDQYYNHLDQAKTAFEKVLADCKSKAVDDPYCKEFKFKYAEDSSQNPLTLTSEAKHITGQSDKLYKITKLDLKYTAPYKEALSKKQHDTASQVEQSAAGPIVGSSAAAALIGLPTVAFFLYKYDLLPSGIKNTLSFGGRRNNNIVRSNRRKRSVKHDFDTLTEDSSTEYSVDYSTAEGSTATDSMTDTSTIYNSNLNRTSNNGRQQRPQQRQQRQRSDQRRNEGRKNISYHRI